MIGMCTFFYSKWQHLCRYCCPFFYSKWQHLCRYCCPKLACFRRSLSRFWGILLLNANPFWVELLYFLVLTSLGFWFLKFLKPRTDHGSFRPRDLDLFFTSVSAATVSSMSTVEMEVFSNPQLLILTLLMFIGGEVFTSMVGLFLRSSKIKKLERTQERVAFVASSNCGHSKAEVEIQQVELGLMAKPESLSSPSPCFQTLDDESHKNMFPNRIKFLGFIVLWYLLAIHVTGSILVFVYIALVSSAKKVLKAKGLNLFTFSVFTTVSTSANCGFVPTNENMVVYGENSVLLLILIPQILLGHTLFPPCLRLCIWMVGKLEKTVKKMVGKGNRTYDYWEYLLKNTNEIGYPHLLPTQQSNYLSGTVFGFIAVQVAMFCALEWNSDSLSGLGGLRWFAAVLFQCVNTRYSGENIVDLSVISPAILVLFVVMMYLPPYTSFLPINDGGMKKRKQGKIVEDLGFSQLSYLVIFIILVCVTERPRMKEDPLNFNVLSITLEVISAYGNVGFTMGYSCKRRLTQDGNCQDKWFGFVGKWSDEGKVILIIVMLFGRLKMFSTNGGRSWKIL